MTFSLSTVENLTRLLVNYSSKGEFQSYVENVKKEEDKFKSLSLCVLTTLMLSAHVSLSNCPFDHLQYEYCL